MPLLATCRHCGASFNLADTMLGKRVRCRQCEKIFTVEEEDAEDDIPKVRAVKRPNQGIRSDARRPAPTVDAPSRRKRDRDRDDDDNSDENSGSSHATLLIILGVGAALFLLGGGLVTYLLVRATSAQPVAVANPPQVVPNQPANPIPNPNPIPNLNPIPNPDPIPPPPPSPLAWQVAVDGPAQVRQALARPQEVIPALNSAKVLFAQGYGPFVAVGSNITNRDGRDIWNLETMQKVGTINGQIKSMDPTLLSPDGNYLLTRTVNLATTFEIYSAATGQRVALVNVDSKVAVLPYVDFAGSDQMVTVKDSIKEKFVQVWDLKTGMLRKQIDAKAVSFDPKAYAVSPGGRYLAMVNESKLSVFDLREGSVAGTTQVPAPRGTLIFSPTSLAFSPDGVELAALFDNPEKVVVWDVVSGKVLKESLLPTNLRTLVSQTTIYLGPTLEWVPDRSGWLYRGFILLDAVSGKPVHTLPTNLEIGFPGPRRMLTANHIAMTTGNGTTRKVQIVELPKDVIDQAVKEARSGQTPGAAPDQKTIAADWATVRQLAPVNGVPPWNFGPGSKPGNTCG